ncbi:MAG: hypothetical protein ACTSSJ_00640 [Candidatus Odinarchaeia archaeon]
MNNKIHTQTEKERSIEVIEPKELNEIEGELYANLSYLNFIHKKHKESKISSFDYKRHSKSLIKSILNYKTKLESFGVTFEDFLNKGNLKEELKYALEALTSIKDNASTPAPSASAESIPSTFTELSEKDIFEKSILGKKKINYEKLGLLICQRGLKLKDENGGILPLVRAYSLLNHKLLENKVTIDDVEKALHLLEKKGVLPPIIKLNSGIKIVQLIPDELNDDQNVVLNIASEKGWTTKEEIMIKTGWVEERAERALKSLVDAGVAKLDSSYSRGTKYYFPNIYLEKNNSVKIEKHKN